MKMLYKTSATATGGRAGSSSLDDASFTAKMVRPGEAKGGLNPEQLFALGYAACFDSAMELTAKKLSLVATGASTSVAIGLGQKPDGTYALDAEITAHLPTLSMTDATRLVEATHLVCPYSNATRGNIEVRLRVEDSGKK
jgi:lipoyl-dependent peroxiredoxin